jgi:hypothetical protein
MFASTMEPGPMTAADAHALELCQPRRRPQPPDVARGYLDLLGDADSVSPGLGQKMMETRLLPRIYQRLWRPVAGRVLMGLGGPGTKEEHRIALEMLSIAPAGRVALLSSCNRGHVPTPIADTIVRSVSGVRIFGRDELTRVLADRGLVEIEQRITGLAQLVSAKRAS